MVFSHGRPIKLAGILYLHIIHRGRLTGAQINNFKLFSKFCGDHALQNVIFATTMWDFVIEEDGHRREKELRGIYWKPMIELGSQVARFRKTHESAWEIVRQFRGQPEELECDISYLRMWYEVETLGWKHVYRKTMRETMRDQDPKTFASVTPNTPETFSVQLPESTTLLDSTDVQNIPNGPSPSSPLNISSTLVETGSIYSFRSRTTVSTRLGGIMQLWSHPSPNTHETLRAQSFESTTLLPEAVDSAGVTDIVQNIPNSLSPSLPSNLSSTLVETESIYTFCSQTTVSTRVGRIMQLWSNPSRSSSVETLE
jgi:hypothetical protein